MNILSILTSLVAAIVGKLAGIVIDLIRKQIEWHRQMRRKMSARIGKMTGRPMLEQALAHLAHQDHLLEEQARQVTELIEINRLQLEMLNKLTETRSDNHV